MDYKIKPSELFGYLESNNWTKSLVVSGGFQLWRNSRHPKSEIILPIDGSHIRFDCLCEEAVELLAETQKISIEELLNSIIEKSCDQLKLKVVAEDVKNGIIPFKDGLSMYESIFKILNEAASRTYKFKNKNDHVKSFIESIGMGQTEIGSFMVTIDSPLYQVPIVDNSEGLIPEVSLGRLINMRLFEILKEMARYLSLDLSEEDLMSNLLNLKLSTKFCDAVISLFGTKAHRDVELKIDWSNKEKIDEYYTSKITFRSTDAPSLVRFRNSLTSYQKESSISLTGQIINLHRDYQEESGLAKFKTRLYGRDTTVSFAVENDQYYKIASAHAKKHSVTVKGQLSSYQTNRRLVASYSEVTEVFVNGNGEFDF